MQKKKNSETDKNKYSIITALTNEIKMYIKMYIMLIFEARKKIFIIIFIIIFIMSLLFAGIASYMLIKHQAFIRVMFNEGYKYNIQAQIMAKLNAPVHVNLPINQNFVVPFKKNIRVSVPIKAKFVVPINKKFVIPIKKPMQITIDHSFPINEIINIDAVFPIDTTTTVNIFGIDKDVRVKGDVPVKVGVPFSQDIKINDTFNLDLKEPITVPINYNFEVPIDMILDLDLPLDINLNVPIKINFDADIKIEEELPILLDIEMTFSLLQGFKVKGIKLNK